MTQRRSTRISRLVLAAVLVAQGILAAHACVVPEASAVKALTTVAETMPCHAAKSINSNECLMHCTQSDQVNLDHHTMVAVSVDDVILHAAIPLLQPKPLTLARAPVVPNIGPPLSIRYCSFLI